MDFLSKKRIQLRCRPSTESALELAHGFARDASTKASAGRTIPMELKSNGMASCCFIMEIIKQLMLS